MRQTSLLFLTGKDKTAKSETHRHKAASKGKESIGPYKADKKFRFNSHRNLSYLTGGIPS